MKSEIIIAINELTSLLNRHLLPMAFIVSVSVHLAVFGLVINRNPLIIIPQKYTLILVTLMQAPSHVFMKESKPIIQPKVNQQPPIQSQAQKVIKQKAKAAFASHEKIPKVQQLVAINKEKSAPDIPHPQIYDLATSMPLDTKEVVSPKEAPTTHQVDATKGIVRDPSKAAKAAPAIKTGASISASYAKTNQKPEYPSQSRRLNEEGTVVLTILVLADGNAGVVEVKASSGFPLLDQSAKDAVMHWHFNPATVDGIPIDELYSLDIPFKLNG